MNETSPIPSGPIQPPPVREVDTRAPLRWLAEGWSDFRRAGLASLLHGIIVCLVSLLILEITVLYWELLPGAVSGFVLTGSRSRWIRLPHRAIGPPPRPGPWAP